ncbi:hypothetical protein K493DRAFT_130856, partial [Basidiobolus meristosporus CBS 931.73]
EFFRCKPFYCWAPKPLGYTIEQEFLTAACYGNSLFTFAEGSPTNIHIAFNAATRKQVDEFDKAALESGGKDNGVSVVRSQRGENYYATFVYDFEGDNFEAVCYK